MMFMHMRSMLLYVICLVHVVYAASTKRKTKDEIGAELPQFRLMLYAVICCYMLYVICLLYV